MTKYKNGIKYKNAIFQPCSNTTDSALVLHYRYLVINGNTVFSYGNGTLAMEYAIRVDIQLGTKTAKKFE